MDGLTSCTFSKTRTDGEVICGRPCPNRTSSHEERCCLNCAKAADNKCDYALLRPRDNHWLCRHQQYAIRENESR